MMINNFVEFVRDLYKTDEFIPLHQPSFFGNEKEYVNHSIETTFVSSVSEYVGQFEEKLCQITGSKYAISIVNGTSALHLSLYAVGADNDCEVITQPLTFVATCNAIAYTGAKPLFLDVDKETLGLDYLAVKQFLEENAEIRDDGACYNKLTNKKIVACVPMHTFGHPLKINELVDLCHSWRIPVIEDAAEALGSYSVQGEQKQHCGTVGDLGVLSFNGNKVVTTGGGGAILTNNSDYASRLKHLSTTAKKPHKWEFNHDEVGFNYRMPGLNAALGCAQLESLDEIIKDKRAVASFYNDWSADEGSLNFVGEPLGAQSNYWLNAFLLPNQSERDHFLKETNESGIMTRPVWNKMNELDAFSDSFCGNLRVSEEVASMLVNVPSSPRPFVINP